MKIAVITGGSRGLGKSAALALAKKGVGVVLTYQSQSQAAEAVVSEIEALGGQAVALRLDISESDSFKGFAAELKGALKAQWQREQFDYLVNNAGIGLHASFQETTEAQFDQLMKIHLKGPFFLTQTLLPLLADQGRILNLSSGLTRFSFPGYAAYAAMKGGVEVLTRYWAKELGSRGIAVNTLAPGAIETDFGGGAVRDNAGLNQMLAAQTSLGRVGVPEDIGPLVASLLSEESRWVNAQRVEASGGMMI
ncbi:short-chain dehydrogenase [bacterium (Candidatus Blackallbacteria) CG17_big_fil_post_rev_8_21_14_2_50_48_46]|uniref:Short-chain dehydrogenase n=1 Tax=bacterium (Candidatus Blackallbacteria) CG17_big_fil_post_rev_8_21_14_2_50_48_46 TaxID=2014261 RepID=A0A2M7G499_9BACT|nr:MAG: short-chain dehydrogenase [bacterium (Candidatus Blackallbacteria) CG18_big_fil_WC_8_21_14_2_50_49_26]PIW16695.1 MAG: short-chain dehydrogenase [bacterium (Candidatus Blackallbacteria) CG17_big_fil_post_rev_8_21_14_2_50_48_46]PIW46201.1 MAG: short-chain dehydrogenase [bacterium (Candidatus Blackallbacteria) CG13_big_fil_rev_8_21_14_2_50_49_14]